MVPYGALLGPEISSMLYAHERRPNLLRARNNSGSLRLHVLEMAEIEHWMPCGAPMGAFQENGQEVTPDSGKRCEQSEDSYKR